MNIPNTISGLQKAGLTQKEIGDAIGRSQSAVSDMAAGKIGTINPSYLIVKRLEALAAERGVAIESAATDASAPVANESKLTGEAA